MHLVSDFHVFKPDWLFLVYGLETRIEGSVGMTPELIILCTFYKCDVPDQLHFSHHP
jgi:hypothetical protein